jgi:hypothetical protein
MAHDVYGLTHAARLATSAESAAQDEEADAELLAPFLSPDPEEDPEDPEDPEDEPEPDEPESDDEDDFDEDDESEEPEPDDPDEPSADDPDFESGLAPDGSLSFLPAPSPFEPLRLSVR